MRMTGKTLLALSLGALFGFSVSVAGTLVAKDSHPPSDKLPLDEMQRFTTVIENIRSYYVEPATDQTLFDNAIRGMLSGLDPHSAYLDPNDFQDLKVSTSGEFGGLGIEVTMEEGFVRVISPVDDTPAARAGIQAGDLIIRIDETPVRGMTLRKAVEMMRGSAGSSLALTIIRKGENKPLKLSLVREVIKVKSVKTNTLPGGFGYVRISQFQGNTGEEMVNAIKHLKTGGKDQPLNGLILDLRNNPGGILEASVKVADAFLEADNLKFDKLIVYTEGRIEGSALRETAEGTDILKGAPLIVLVNGGSASASEIVAGALQDHKRALIVGTRTFGKGSVQTVLPLQDDYGLKLTTALYYTPKGRSIQATGIEPDIEVKEMKLPETPKEDEDWASIREQDLEGHLANRTEAGKEESAKTPAEKDKSVKAEADEWYRKDYQLIEAYQLLKGLAISRGL